tara:strand:+ start:532 stop:1077 length:546 start_codon:yes stop_codon:yes gene_type:complete
MAGFLTRRLKQFSNKTDIVGKNNHFLRVKINRETGEVKRVNENNWTEEGIEHFNKCYPNAMVVLSTIKFRTKKNAPTQKAVFDAIIEPAATTSKPEKIDMLITASKVVDDTSNTSNASDTSFIDEIVKPKTIAVGINSLVEASKTIENPEEETVDAETIKALTSTDEEVMVTIIDLQKTKN